MVKPDFKQLVLLLERKLEAGGPLPVSETPPRKNRVVKLKNTNAAQARPVAIGSAHCN
jgi:hypothetical protein